MKTIDCALAQDLMPLYTEGMLSPESREALEEHLAGCEACRRTADEMCHPLLEPQFQEEARLLRRLRRRRKALWAAVIVLAALLVLLPYAKAELEAQLGKSGCSMAACTDFGLSAAFLEALAEKAPEEYGPLSLEMERRADKAARRRAAGPKRKPGREHHE